jgi:hypothetical protein
LLQRNEKLAAKFLFMSLDDIKFSPFLVKKLFEKSLIVSSFAEIKNMQNQPVLNDKTETLKKESISNEDMVTIKFLGKNAKNILVLVNEKEHAFLGDEQLSFLMNILNACNVSMADAALVNINSDESIKYEILMHQFSPEIILFLGTEPQLLGFPVQIPMYQIQQYNKQQYLCAPSLQKLSTDKDEKKQLWLCLKKIFFI